MGKIIFVQFISQKIVFMSLVSYLPISKMSIIKLVIFANTNSAGS